MYAFSHIPKTAGTSLNYLLRRYYGPKLLAVDPRKKGAYTQLDLKKDLKLFKNIQCITSHRLKPFMPFDQELQWFTFMRNPEKRFISQYIHQQTGKVEQYKMDIFAWSKKFKRSNWHTKWIAGEEDLEAAKQIIEEKNIFVGLTERFDESILLMKKALNMEGADLRYGSRRMVVRNTTIKDEIINNYDKYKELILEQNEKDIALYNYVSDHVFSKSVEAYGKEQLATDLSELQASIANYENTSSWKYTRFRLQHNLLYKPYRKLS